MKAARIRFIRRPEYCLLENGKWDRTMFENQLREVTRFGALLEKILGRLTTGWGLFQDLFVLFFSPRVKVKANPDPTTVIQQHVFKILLSNPSVMGLRGGPLDGAIEGPIVGGTLFKVDATTRVLVSLTQQILDSIPDEIIQQANQMAASNENQRRENQNAGSPNQSPDEGEGQEDDSETGDSGDASSGDSSGNDQDQPGEQEGSQDNSSGDGSGGSDSPSPDTGGGQKDQADGGGTLPGQTPGAGDQKGDGSQDGGGAGGSGGPGPDEPGNPGGQREAQDISGQGSSSQGNGPAAGSADGSQMGRGVGSGGQEPRGSLTDESRLARLDLQVQQALEALGDQIADNLTRQGPEILNKMKTALAREEEKEAQLNKIMAAQGFDLTQDFPKQGSPDDRLELATRLQENKKVQEMMDLFGNSFLAQQEHQQTQGTIKKGFEMTRYVRTGHVHEALPSQLWVAAHPDLQGLLALKMALRQFFKRVRWSKAEGRKGGIVLLLDVSGSMYQERIYLAAGIATALCKMAHDQSRPMTVIPFNGRALHPIRMSENRLGGMAEVAGLLASGGTDFERAIEAGLEEVERWELPDPPDLVIITDGDSRIRDHYREEFRKAFQKHRVNPWGVYVGMTPHSCKNSPLHLLIPRTQEFYLQNIYDSEPLNGLFQGI